MYKTNKIRPHLAATNAILFIIICVLCFNKVLKQHEIQNSFTTSCTHINTHNTYTNSFSDTLILITY